MTETNTLLSELIKGGWTMIPLGLCSLALVAIIIERLIWGPRLSKVIPTGLKEEVLNLIHRGKIDETIGLCRANNSSFARIILAGVTGVDRPRVEIEAALEVAGRIEAQNLSKWIPTLAIMGSASPLLGLLGTVFGIINTFSVISSQGIGNSQLLAGGISEALICTATGLTIAIPALIISRYLSIRTQILSEQLEAATIEVLALLSSKSITALPTRERQITER